MFAISLHGDNYSVYVRIARLVLEELEFAYTPVPHDVFAAENDAYLSLNPFGKIPALEHHGFRLYETDAIAHYLIALHGDSSLLPSEPQALARTLQIMRIMDNYAYRRLVWGVYVAQVEGNPSGQELKEACAEARTVLDALDGIAGAPWLVGPTLTLADLWAYPMLVYFELAPAGRAMMANYHRLSAWLDLMAVRPSARSTRFPAEAEQLQG